LPQVLRLHATLARAFSPQPLLDPGCGSFSAISEARTHLRSETLTPASKLAGGPEVWAPGKSCQGNYRDSDSASQNDAGQVCGVMWSGTSADGMRRGAFYEQLSAMSPISWAEGDPASRKRDAHPSQQAPTPANKFAWDPGAGRGPRGVGTRQVMPRQLPRF
jgi:hypothetical protein